MRGSLLFPRRYNLLWFFQISNSPDTDQGGCLKQPTTTTQQSLTAGGSLEPVEAQSNQSAGASYYYQLVIIINCGEETEAAFCGNVVASPTATPLKSKQSRRGKSAAKKRVHPNTGAGNKKNKSNLLKKKVRQVTVSQANELVKK